MHLPVLREEVINFLDLKQGDCILDATVGGGGHALEIVKRIGITGRLIAVDRDIETIERTKVFLYNYKNNITYINGNFSEIEEILNISKVTALDGAVFDLGFSSYQIEDEKRGFSFLRDGPLDMRFDLRQDITAADIVNRARKEELFQIIKDLGEERFAWRIASAIEAERKKQAIRTTLELVEVIKKAVGNRYSKQRIHPAARTFQALRISVNKELDAVKEALIKVVPVLKRNARVCVISFHSLEDRIVKNIFRQKEKEGMLKVLTKKIVVPNEEEMSINPRSRSAKLRVGEKAV